MDVFESCTKPNSVLQDGAALCLRPWRTLVLISRSKISFKLLLKWVWVQIRTGCLKTQQYELFSPPSLRLLL